MDNSLLRLKNKKLLDIKVSSKIKSIINEWYKKYQNGELKEEVRNYPAFQKCILEGLLGYKLGSDFEFEYPLNGRSVEFMIIKDGGPYIAIELKGSKTTDLTKKSGDDKYSAVEQASNYASKESSIKWYIVSNYYEFRLYHHTSQNRYISFNLDDLRPSGYDFDEKRIQQFLTVFSKKSVLEKDYLDKLHDSKGLFPEDFNLQNEFYKLYNETRLMLIKELEETNNLNKDEAIEYAQLILNRYIFICFCEDKGLLPDNLTSDEILTPIRRKVLAISTIWSRLNELFYFINNGNPDNDITGYNGGLFKKDISHFRIRDKIDNDFYKDINVKWKFPEQEYIVDHELVNYPNINQIYRNLLMISSFDFNTDLTENILGHIFENSISDLEELKNEQQSKRKKEGVYYTPEEITTYICENTIIPYLSNKDNNNIDALINEYSNNFDELEDKLHNIKILDPACGSGAFLNKATDTLLAIHKAIFNFKHENNDNLDKEFDNIDNRREILLNNIYGVDLNHESVEITKLGLFLKVCKKGIKLPDLDKNIKCGNSLIEDSEFTDKPFKWEKEFSEIFDNNGFDIIIGNPPYGIFIDENLEEYYSKHYPLTKYKINLYILFIERMMQIFNNSIVHFIIPKSLLFNSYNKDIRKELLKNTTIIEILTITEKVFKDAEVGGSLLLKIELKKPDLDNKIKFIDCQKVDDIISYNAEKTYNSQKHFLSTQDYEISFISSKSKAINSKLFNLKTISDFYNLKNGLNPGNIKHILISDTKENEKFKPIIWGKDIKKYNINWSKQFINYDKDIKDNISIDDLKSKKGMNKQQKIDFALRTPDIFECSKIVIRKTGDSLISAYDDNNYYFDTLVHGIYQKSEEYDLLFLLAILNSFPATFFYQLLHDIKGKVFAKISLKNLSNFPIPETPIKNQKPLINLANDMNNLNKELHEEIESFQKYLISDFKVAKINKKLTEYYNLSFDELYKEVKKQYKGISRQEKDKLEKEFISSLDIIHPLQKEIKNINNKIDKLVYELYNLTEDEIKIIEKSFE